MRWGVGKGKFRNLSAIVLCLVLVATFWLSWKFFERVKPLVVDSSLDSRTATIADRLLSRDSEETHELCQRDLLLFALIADSLDELLRKEFVPAQRSTKFKQNPIAKTKLADVQQHAKRIIAAQLNTTFQTILDYREVERKVLSVFSTSLPGRDKADNSKLKSAPYYRVLETFPETRIVSALFAKNYDSVKVSAEDSSLIVEMAHLYRNKLYPFGIGLTSDEILYERIIQSDNTLRK